MKTYVDYRLALSIGLLSLSTLSSCVNRGQSYMDQPEDCSQSRPATEKDGSSTGKEVGNSVEHPVCLSPTILKSFVKKILEQSIKNSPIIGLDINAKDKEGWNILMHLVHEDGALYDDLTTGCKRPEVREAIQKLLSSDSYKIDLNAQDNDGNTTLMIAAKRNNIALIHFLIEKGVNPFITNKELDNVITLLIKSTYRLYHIDDLKSGLGSVFKDIKKYIQNHGMPSNEQWTAFLNSIRKSIQEKREQDNTIDYEQELNDFIKSVGKETA